MGGNEEFSTKVNPAAGLLPFGCVAVACGAATLGLGSALWGGELLTMADAWELAEASGAATAARVTIIGTYLGGAVVVGGLLAIAGGLMKNRVVGIVALTLTALSGVVQIYAGVSLGPIITTSFAVLEPSSYDANYDATEQALIDTAHAVFNKCCFDDQASDPNIPEVWVNDTQKRIKECPPETPGLNKGDELVCTQLPDIIIDIIGQEIGSLLCTCYKGKSYQPVFDAIVEQDLCPAFAKISAPVGKDLKIPVAGLTVDFALSQTQFAGYLPVADTSMAGPAAPRVPAMVNGVKAQPSDGTEGFGCGLGFAKGVAWVQNMYLENEVSGVLYVLLGVGAVQLISSGLVVALWMLGGGSSSGDEQWMQSYEQKAVVAPAAP